MNRSSGGLGVFIAIVWTGIAFMTGWLAATLLSPAPAAPRASATLFDEAWGHVSRNFVGTVPSDTLREYGAIRGALATLDDRYSYFIEPQTRTVERDHMRGAFGGIGVGFQVNAAGDVVLTPNADGPAARVGVLAGDLLRSVDGRVLPKPAQPENVVGLRGEVGSTVAIEVERAGGLMLRFEIIRELIRVPSVEATLIDKGGRFGLIKISSFTERTGAEVREAVQTLGTQGVQGYLIDLRDNGGGVLSAAVDVASEFMAEGDVLIEQKRGQDDVRYPVRDSEAITLPVVVLINGNSASASEVVAGALRDAGRAKLIGQKSFGKGSVQLIFDLRDGSSVHVTTSKWLTPKRGVIDGNGLLPDVEVDNAEAQLERGLAALRQPYAQSAP
jgi:carboxyl-terminal processing protease